YFKLLKLKAKQYHDAIIDQFSHSKSPADFWKIIEQVKRRPTAANNIPLDIWHSYFINSFPPRTSYTLDLPHCYHDSLDQEFTMNELIIQLRKILTTIDEEDLLLHLSAQYWKLNKIRILDKFHKHLKLQDLRRYSNSKACQIPIPNSLFDESTAYLIKNEFSTLISKIQLRLANNYSCRIILNRNIIQLRPTEPFTT
ncbi:hypothetical protein KQX54_013747, partial [Cotesia glomerata]